MAPLKHKCLIENRKPVNHMLTKLAKADRMIQELTETSVMEDILLPRIKKNPW